MLFSVKSLLCEWRLIWKKNFSLYCFDAEMIFKVALLKTRHVAAEAT